MAPPSLTSTSTSTSVTYTSPSPKPRRPSPAVAGAISLRSAVKEPLNRAGVTVTPPEHPHTFRPRSQGQSRSPCPALNTLANHGYLPRDGYDITPSQFMAALRNPATYNLSLPLAIVLVYGGIFMYGGFLMMLQASPKHVGLVKVLVCGTLFLYGGLSMLLERPPISLHYLARHNFIEHDASMVHNDTASGDSFAPTFTDPAKLDTFLKESVVDLDRVASRRVELERETPLDALHQGVARGEWALVLDIFGRALKGKIPSKALRVWLDQNQFPEGWKPSHQQGLLATVRMSYDIHQKMTADR